MATTSPPRPLSEHDLLTVAQAVAELGMRKADAEAWLEARRLIRRVAGRRRVIWGDVLAAIREAEPERPQRPRQGRRVQARVTPRMSDAF